MNKLSLIVQSLGWSLLHSLWQGAIVFICLTILLKAIGKGHARMKYALSMLSLSGLFAWFVYTWLSKWHWSYAYAVNKLQSGTVSYNGTINTTVATNNTSGINSLLSTTSVVMEPYLPIVVMVYSVGLFLMFLRLGMGIQKMQHLRTNGLVNVDATQGVLLKKLLTQLRISTAVKLYFSEWVNVPMVMGSIKPIILLPLASINNLSTEELETILVHELAHIKRHDYLINIFQMVVETLLFFNPFTWLISAIIRREREHCCDDMVIIHTQHPLPYAKALATLESYRNADTKLALAATGNKDQLFNRIKRIMEMKKNAINYSHLIVTVLIVITLLLSISIFSPLSAQTRKNKTPKTNTSATTTTQKKIIIIDDNGNKKEYDSEDDIPEKDKQIVKEEINKEEENTNGKKVKRKLIIKDNTVAISQIMSDAMDNIDWEEISNEMNDSVIVKVQKQLNNIDYDALLKNLEKSLEKVQAQLSDPKLQKNVQMEIDKAKQEIERAKKELLESKKNMDNGQKQRMIVIKKKNNADPAANMEYAKATPNKFDNMLSKMEQDGLIDQSKDYEIEKKHNALYIDGIKQSSEVYNKYESYLKEKTISIKKKDNTMNVNVLN